MFSVIFFNQNDKREFTAQFSAVLRIFFVFDETSEEYGLFSKKILQLQQKCNEHQRFELIETNEQALADTRFNNREFIPTVPKRLIRLRRRMDLKNRTLVSQLRDRGYESPWWQPTSL